MKFDDVLDTFKADEDAENIMPLIEEAPLRNALVAWKSVRIQTDKSNDCTLSGGYERWAWLWDCVKCDTNAWGVVAGIKPQEVSTIFARLKGLRLIYPDGTISTLAKQYMQGIIMAKLPKPKKPKADID